MFGDDVLDRGAGNDVRLGEAGPNRRRRVNCATVARMGGPRRPAGTSTR